MRDLVPSRHLPLTLFAALLVLPLAPLSAQQPTTSASSTAPLPTPAPAPTPHPSPLFAQPTHDSTSLAAAERTHREATMSSNHTFTVSTAVIVLSAIIVILLVA